MTCKATKTAVLPEFCKINYGNCCGITAVLQWYGYLAWLKYAVAALATNKTSEGIVDFNILLFLKNVNNTVHITLLFLLALNWIGGTFLVQLL